MVIHVHITEQRITEREWAAQVQGAGAWVDFRGVVRGEEDGKEIAALEYEAYVPMAEREMRRLLEDIQSRHPCLAVRVIHRTGIIPAGETAIHVAVRAKHRAEAFALATEFMDRLKQDVPIWKRRALAEDELERFRSLPLSTKSERPRSADEVRQQVRALCAPLEVERVPLDQGLGRISGEAVHAPEDQPAFHRSAVDGYAIGLDDPSMVFRVMDEIRAGEWKPRRLGRGEAVRVATGAAVPAAHVRVVMKEDVRLEGDRLSVLRRDGARHIRFQGEDARAGQVLIEPGEILQPGTLALLASVGCVQPSVTRRPHVRHIATGNEIVSPNASPSLGQIRDSNSTLVRAFLAEWGIVPEQRRVDEGATALAKALQLAVGEPDPDLVLISGGASVGEHDVTRAVLASEGFHLHVSKAAVRPGKPLVVAKRGRTLAFGLPGNPLSHFVCLQLFVRMALETLSGQTRPSAFVTGVMTSELAWEDSGRETFWPARWSSEAGQATVTPLRWMSSGDLTSLATANALIRLPFGASSVSRGDPVKFMPTTRT